ncbi:hypothetical protein GDO81_028110 [Engystomops pustulosus]|uniref:Uncharacterized protein n=1 Tax=Engystomops pustulosus TaxID=76066 RepID=A0AAV6YHM5_ENGPU|nr:hypothetical protein GDO81_028110 [Engystomops pustulosus]
MDIRRWIRLVNAGACSFTEHPRRVWPWSITRASPDVSQGLISWQNVFHIPNTKMASPLCEFSHVPQESTSW